MDSPKTSGDWLWLVTIGLVAVTLVIVLGVIPIAVCARCDGRGKIVGIPAADVVVDPGGTTFDSLTMKVVEHRPTYSFVCELCGSKGRVPFVRKWISPTTFDVGELVPDGPITTTLEPDQNPARVKKLFDARR